MEDIENNEPIFELAGECEKLYAEQISRLNDVDDPNGTTFLSELNQRFAAWAAFLGVFAESKICLDHRLRHHIEIQDQVLLLLEIMQRNLTYLFEPDPSTEPMEVEFSDGKQHPLISISGLEAISGAIERLNHLGIAIRQSSVSSQATKNRKFAETFDFTSFEEVAYLSLRTLYADASESLLEQLTRCMTETYTLFIRRKYRQERLQAPRAEQKRPILLSPTKEQPNADADFKIPVLEAGTLWSSKALRSPSPQAGHIMPHSEPTSVDTREVKAKFKRMLSPPSKPKTMSILVNQVDYPQPTKESLTCDWCFSPLPADSLKGARWRQHVNEDHKPYVCISEKCFESLPRFATSTQWLQHMLSIHGQNWHREVHTPSSWACPLCTEDATFSKPSDLAAHLDNLHEGTFTESQVHAILRQSQLRLPRQRDVCPLCCLFIEDRHEPLSRAGHGDGESFSKRAPFLKHSESSHKRMKTEAGYIQSDENNGEGLETTTDQAEPEISVEMIASHIATHLQGVMLLTLRLISIDVVMKVSADHESASGTTDNQSSWVVSDKIDLDQEFESISDFSIHGDAEIDAGDMSPSEDIIPDSEYIDWHDVPGYFEASFEDSHPLEVATPGSYDTFNEICNQIREQIYREMERRDDSESCFVTKGTAKKTLHRDNLQRFLGSILLPEHTAMDDFQINTEDFARIINARQLHDFLAILIFSKCSISMARTFTIKLVADWPSVWRESPTCTLPSDREELRELLGNKVAADEFFTNQACFCPIVIRKGEGILFQTPKKQRLPYLEEKVHSIGEFGSTIFKVRVAKGHFYDPRTKSANLEPVEMARKEYILNDGFHAKKQRQVMTILTSCSARCKNIVEIYGILDIGSITYSLFMPIAICDLWTYMMDVKVREPSSNMEKADIIFSALGLARGLNFLHDEAKASNREELVEYQMGLHPGKILIFQEAQNGKTHDIWKISGFGLARVVSGHRGKDREEATGVNSLLDTAKPTLMEHRKVTYLAPELFYSDSSVGAKSDAWSLGCVISVIFAYLEDGFQGVADFENARLDHSDACGYDCFFVHSTGFSATKSHPIVTSWHRKLIDQAHNRDSDEGDAVKFMLRYLEKSVLQIAQAKRHGFRKVEEKLLETFRKYQLLV